MKKVPITPKVREILERQRRAFREKFGRDPGPRDPVFFDPSADEPRPFSKQQMAEYEALTLHAMQKAGVDPAKVYASKRTGRIVTEDNWKYLTKEERAEWVAAVNEYRDRARGGQ